jgi:hypothetical protein
MTQLTSDRNTLTKDGRIRSLSVAAGKVIWAGSLVMVNAAGFAEPASAATGKVAAGRAEHWVDNTSGADGAQIVRVTRGVFAFANSTGADAISRTEIGKTVYAVDDQTVAKTDGTASRSAAGRVFDVDADGVWVEIL